MAKRQRDARAGWHAARSAANPRPPMAMSTSVIGTPLPEFTPCKCCRTSVCGKVPRGWAVAEPGITFDGDYKPRGYDSAVRLKVDNVIISGVIAPPEAERCQCGCWGQKRPAPEPVQAEPQHDVRLEWKVNGYVHYAKAGDCEIAVFPEAVTLRWFNEWRFNMWDRAAHGLIDDDAAKAFVEAQWRERGGNGR